MADASVSTLRRAQQPAALVEAHGFDADPGFLSEGANRDLFVLFAHCDAPIP